MKSHNDNTNDSSGLTRGRTEDRRNILSHRLHLRFSYSLTRKSRGDQVLTPTLTLAGILKKNKKTNNSDDVTFGHSAL